jgi:hypothetical protein
MTEQELRALVREAIARAGVAAGRSEERPLHVEAGLKTGGYVIAHSSHAMFTLAPGDPEGRCIIEPGVACNHCGYCKSYGH